MSDLTPACSDCDGAADVGGAESASRDPGADAAAFEAAHHHGYLSDKEAYLRRLKRIEGQVRGIERMVSEDTYCVSIITQISAITSALENVGLALMNDHLKSCVGEAAAMGGKVSDEALEEAMTAVRRLVKS